MPEVKEDIIQMHKALPTIPKLLLDRISAPSKQDNYGGLQKTSFGKELTDLLPPEALNIYHPVTQLVLYPAGRFSWFSWGSCGLRGFASWLGLLRPVAGLADLVG